LGKNHRQLLTAGGIDVDVGRGLEEFVIDYQWRFQTFGAADDQSTLGTAYCVHEVAIPVGAQEGGLKNENN